MLFTVFFVATRDIKVSIILTGIFIFLTMELFHEKSNNCIIPKSWLKKLKQSITDTTQTEKKKSRKRTN